MQRIVPEPREHPAMTENKLRVLLVDDHPLMRSAVKDLLRAQPDIDVVAEVDDGALAVTRARELSPQVVIMDVSLPHLGGAEATKQILAANPEIRVLALSAHQEPAFARLLLDNGAAGYVLKRCAGDELIRAVRVVASGGTYLDSSLTRVLVGARHRRMSPGGVPVATLSERETEVIRMVAHGHTAKEIALALALSPRTMETYKARAMYKLNLRTRADLVRYAMRCGWLQGA